MILIMFKYLKNANIDIVLLANDVNDRYKALTLVCSKLNISTVVVQHGVTGHYTGFVPSYSKYFATWGKISREFLISNGMDPHKIVMTGCPRFDIYLNINRNISLKKEIKDKIYKKFGIKKNTRLIVLTTFHGQLKYKFNTSMLNSEIKKLFNILFNAIKNISNVHLIIKLHLNDMKIGMIKDLIKLHEMKNVSITRDFNIVDLIIACDCFISGDSTTVIEAMLVEKPIICIDFDEREYVTPYFEYNTVYKASNSHELVNQINKAFKEPVLVKNREQFLKDYLYSLDGFSTRRVISLIKIIIRKNR